MTQPSNDHFRYFPVPRELSVWGLGVTAAGHSTVAPGSEYPPLGHPEGYNFSWAQGRVLDVFQILYIGEGKGIFETRHSPAVRVGEGDAFLLIPNVWHRYQPDKEVGWVESWVEIGGPVVESLVASRTLSAHALVIRNQGRLAPIMAQVQDLARETVGFSPEMSALAYQLIALCRPPTQASHEGTVVDRAVLSVQRYLDHHYAEPVDLPGLAAGEGIAYSYLRREFRARTGFALWQYVVHLRLLHAKRLLASTSFKLEDIALQLGFNSGFHLSMAFKKSFGKPPAQWRNELKQPPPFEF